MTKPFSFSMPCKLTVLAALLAGLSGVALAAPDHLVISQVYGGGGNSSASAGTATYKNDFIELFNPTAATISLAGWSVQYGSSGSTGAWSGVAPLSGSIAPGQYLLVKLQGGAAGIDLPSPSLTPASGSFNMSGTTGKVALVKSTTVLSGATPTSADLVDWVGFGTANGAEGGALAVAPSGITTNTTAMLRNGAGCTDTDNNRADFTVGDVAPRTTESPLNSCGGSLPPAAAPIVASCPALTVLGGAGGSGTLSASDTDSIVNNAVLAANANAGFTLGAFAASPANGQPGTVSFNVASTVPAGSYSVGVTFSNDGGQSASCNVAVTVQQAPGTVYTIPQLQGAGETSPHPGVQTTEGVITLKLPNGGFYLQDRNGDNDPTTSDGLYVFGATTQYNVGDRIRITGTIVDFKSSGAAHTVTEMKDVSNITFLATETPITPVNITMPTDLARYEGMLVRITNDLIVNDTGSVGDRGELTLSSIRREVPTNRYRPGPAAQALAASNAADQIVLDDKFFSQQPTIPYLAADKTVRAGDTVGNLVGVIDYGSIGNSNYGYKFQPLAVADVTISRTNPRPEAPQLAGGTLRVASANVLNFFTTFTDGTAYNSTATSNTCTLGSSASKSNCRGADSLAEFVRQRSKIVNELKALNADVVGLMEIQNNGNAAVQHLVDTLNGELGGPVYAAVGVPSFTGTDAIRVAMIYKPLAVTPVGGPLADPDTLINDRPPLAQTFKAVNGATFSVIVNHLKSKRCSGASGGNADKNDGQGCFNADRVLQTQRLRNYFIPAVIQKAADPDVLIIGDFNSHGFEDPIDALTGDGFMVNELERFVRPSGLVYSYVFDGEAGYLDHAMATPSLNAQVAGATEFHNNADEPEVIDYNFNLGTSTTAKPQDLYVNNAYRASDHDPVVVSLNLTPTFVDVSASFTATRTAFALNRATGQYGASLILNNTSGAPVTGPFQVEIAGLPAGTSLANATGSHNGVPYITVNSASVAAGASVTVSLVVNNPAKVPLNYSATIYSGTY